MFQVKGRTKALIAMVVENRSRDKEWYDAWAWPGGYPMYYFCKDGGVLCPKCANDNRKLTNKYSDPQWYIIGCEVNWALNDLQCDHCHKFIESAYGEADPDPDDEEV
jgi:hypothetical protein